MTEAQGVEVLVILRHSEIVLVFIAAFLVASSIFSGKR